MERMDETILDDVNRSVTSYHFAGFWIRLGALFIDYLVLMVVMVLISLATQNSPFVGVALIIISAVLYYPIMEASSYQGTLGKLAVGIKVIAEQDGKTLTFGQAFVRFLMRIVSGMILYIGFLMMLWSDKSQTLHDRVAGALVVMR